MNLPTIILLLGFVLLACRNLRSPRKTKLRWFQRLSGSQKIFGIVAFALALVILLNPEFLALGLLGDTAFFDVLVLALGLQLHTYLFISARWLVTALRKSARWAGIPSPGLCYLLAVSSVAFGNLVSHLHKTLQRIL